MRYVTCRCTSCLARHGLPEQSKKPGVGVKEPQRGAAGVQGVELGVQVLHLAPREGDRLAGLALIASLRKRLANLPGELAADAPLRVRLPRRT